MEEQNDEPISPTFKKILDEFLAALQEDEDVNNETARKLDALLRQGKTPKFEDIDAVLVPESNEEKP